MVDSLLAYQSMFYNVLDVAQDGNFDSVRSYLRKLENGFYPVNREITHDQIKGFIQLLNYGRDEVGEELDWGDVKVLSDENDDNIKEAHRKGLLKEGWDRNSGWGR